MSFNVEQTLSVLILYKAFSKLIRKKDSRKLLLDYISPTSNAKIFDIGCGPASILEILPPDIEYVGLDSHPAYIEDARVKHPITFICSSIEDYKPQPNDQYDRVLAIGVLHHLFMKYQY